MSSQVCLGPTGFGMQGGARRPRPNEKDMAGCAISGILCEDGELIDGTAITASIANMHERSKGLGGGLAAYGIYPEFAQAYAFHLMYETPAAREHTEAYLHQHCEVLHAETIPTAPVAVIPNRPVLHRYFMLPREELRTRFYELTEQDMVSQIVMHVNANVEDAMVFSSGKNMGVFKGVGYPEDIARFYRLAEYRAYMWIAHGRFPTNTTGWWGGAHPFGLLDWAVVHNGEVSSYGINRRYLANFGYFCAMQTDTEVITYLFDLLVRKHGLPMAVACQAMAPPFWTQIERMPADQQELARALRIAYGGALLNGPFSVLVGHRSGMVGFNDRTKLRPMCAAREGDRLYVASEESAIRVVCPLPDRIWQAEAWKPIIGQLKETADASVAD